MGKKDEPVKEHKFEGAKNNIILVILIVYVVLLAIATFDEIFGWGLLSDIL